MAEQGATDWGPSYAAFVASTASLSREEFLRRFTAPHFLVWAVEAGGAKVEEALFATMRMKPLTASARTPRAIVAVTKRAGSNAFADMITLGRAPNNDLVFPDGAISKFHCYLRRLGDDWRLTDARSTNGTTVEGKLLEPGGSIRLTAGTKVSLGGSFLLEFLDPSALFTRVHAQ